MLIRDRTIKVHYHQLERISQKNRVVSFLEKKWFPNTYQITLEIPLNKTGLVYRKIRNREKYQIQKR